MFPFVGIKNESDNYPKAAEKIKQLMNEVADAASTSKNEECLQCSKRRRSKFLHTWIFTDRLAALTLHVTLEDEVGIVQMAAAARYMAESGKGETPFPATDYKDGWEGPGHRDEDTPDINWLLVLIVFVRSCSCWDPTLRHLHPNLNLTHVLHWHWSGLCIQPREEEPR
ncbi:hypothetical protein C0Q70_00112 [Pomacea canaliculata]|uniref:Uncharacterized protein n=1 Tax=Pomacea canaliculata TaxID=400727 RepID=A0A2T7PVS7_POMCA|nr:hypothetical protein C0Q70_00112 [Pomacea canaliculata]